MKWSGIVHTGGEAKSIIKAGHVYVNGVVETRRGRKLIEGDHIDFDNERYTVHYSEALGRKLDVSDLKRT